MTLDIRLHCDLFLVLIADSVYNARARVLLETVAIYLGFGWLDVVKFEKTTGDGCPRERTLKYETAGHY